MSIFCCPVCGDILSAQGNSFLCPSGHCFDRARQSYVNLSLSNKSAGSRSGDDAAMLCSRRTFLESGYYAPVRDAILSLSLPRLETGDTILDAGCGEGYYTAALCEALRAEGKTCFAAGIDLSRDAVKAAAQRRCGMELAVASCAHIPIADGTFAMVWNIFSPPEITEYARVLRPGGTLIRALPLERHLFELKAAVYDEPYLNGPPPTELPDFALAGQRDVTGTLHLPSPEDIAALFHMTPYWYKTSRRDQEKLAALPSLDVTLAIRVAAYTKQK